MQPEHFDGPRFVAQPTNSAESTVDRQPAGHNLLLFAATLSASRWSMSIGGD